MQRAVDFVQEEQKENLAKAAQWSDYASQRRGELKSLLSTNDKPNMQRSLAQAVRARDTAFLAHAFGQSQMKKDAGVGPIQPHVKSVSAIRKRLVLNRGVVPLQPGEEVVQHCMDRGLAEVKGIRNVVSAALRGHPSNSRACVYAFDR